MRFLWKILASTELTIILAALICIDAAYGSVLTVKYSDFYRSFDQLILFPALLDVGTESLRLTFWIYILILLVALFTLNTVICTTDRLFQIYTTKAPWRLIIPHIVHIGFLIAVLGHLASSVSGFKSPYNLLNEGEVVPVPHTENLSVRLDSVLAEYTDAGDMDTLETTVTLFKGDDEEFLTSTISINDPLIYKGIAFYHLKHGRTPSGLLLGVDGELLTAPFGGSFTLENGEKFLMGEMYPDFALDASGKAYSRSERYNDPRQEIISPTGERAYLDVSSPGKTVKIDGRKVRLVNYRFGDYAVLMISKDTGIWLIIFGSSVLTLGIILIFVFRGGRAELMIEGKGIENSS